MSFVRIDKIIDIDSYTADIENIDGKVKIENWVEEMEMKINFMCKFVLIN